MIKRMIIGIAIVVVVAAAGYYLWTNYGYKILPATTKKATLLDIAASKPQEICTFDEGGWAGTYYFAGNKIRADYKAATDGSRGPSFMIFDGQFYYIWDEGGLTGIKIPYDPGSTFIPTGVVDSESAWKFTCKPWNVDDSKFIPPSNITFAAPSQKTTDQSTESGILLPPVNK